MPSEPLWLSVEIVVEINRAAVAITGETHFVRGAGLLESAVARSQNAFAYGEEDLVTLAVRLMAGIVLSHPFEQGNKRTAFIAMTQYRLANGYDVVIEDTEAWAEPVIALIERRSTENDFVRAIRPFVVPRS